MIFFMMLNLRTFVAYCILRNISHAKYFCKIFRNMRHNEVNCCFGLKLWYFAHKKDIKEILVISLIWLQKRGLYGILAL